MRQGFAPRRTARGAALLAALVIAVGASPGVAQVPPPKGASATTPPGGQVSEPVRGPRARSAVPQLTDARAPQNRPEQIASPADRRDQPGQLTSVADRTPTTQQANRERRVTPPAPQIYRGGATAQAPDALSRPAEGRRQALVRLGGNDRCDPQASGAGQARCAAVIETRSAEFQRSDPLVLSPEQRLLIDQRLREAPAGTQSEVKRIGRNDVNPDTADAQTLASLMLTPPPAEPPAGSPEAAVPADVNASTLEIVIQALTQGAQGAAPR